MFKHRVKETLLSPTQCGSRWLLRQHDPQLAFHFHDAKGLQAESAAGAVNAPSVERFVNRAVRPADEELAVGGEEVVVVVQRHRDVPARILVGDEMPAHVRREARALDAFMGISELERAARRQVSGEAEWLGACHGAAISIQ